jgi:hypothetical protein
VILRPELLQQLYLDLRDISNALRVWRLAPSNTSATLLGHFFALCSRSQPPAILIVVPLLCCGPTSLTNNIHFPPAYPLSLYQVLLLRLAQGVPIATGAREYQLQYTYCVEQGISSLPQLALLSLFSFTFLRLFLEIAH